MALISSGVAALLVSAVVGGVGLPFGVPPAPEDPMIDRVAPEKCLFYLSWAGTASPDAKSENPTEQLLAEPEVQRFLTQLGAIVAGKLKESLAEKELLTDDPAGLLLDVSTHPGALFIETYTPAKKPENAKPGAKTAKASGEKSPTLIVAPAASPIAAPATASNDSELGLWCELSRADAGVVVSLGNAAAAWNSKWRELIEKKWNRASEIVSLGGGDWYGRVGPCAAIPCNLCIGFHGDYLIAASNEKTFKSIVTRLKGQNTPKWLSDIGRKLPVDKRSVFIYADLQAIAKLAEPLMDVKSPKDRDAMLEMLGLANARAWIEVWGLEGRDFANKSLLLLDGEPQGLLQVATESTVRPEDAAAIPSDATFGAAYRFDTQKALDVILAAVDKMTPEARDVTIKQIEEWEKTFGVDFRHGFLKSFGDAWQIYGSPTEGNFFITGTTVVVPLRDWAGMNVAYGRLMGFAKQWQPGGDESSAPMGTRPNADPAPVESFRFADNDIYCITSGVSLGFLGAAPAWCMTKRELILALSPQNVKAYLSRDSRHVPISKRPEVARLFSQDAKGGPAMIAYGDAPHAFEMSYPLFGIFGGVVLPMAAFEGSGRDGSNEGFNAFSMPSCLSIRRHLGPTVATLRRTPDGVEFVSRGTVPLPSVAFLLGLQSLNLRQTVEPPAAVVAPPATTP